MKKTLILSAFVFCAASTFAQKSFNVFVGAEAAKSTSLFSTIGLNENVKEGFTYIGGEYGYNKWKLSVGYGYGKIFTPKSGSYFYGNDPTPKFYYYTKYTNTNYQVPITVGYNMQNNPHSPLQVFLVMGYTFGRNFKTKQYYYKDNPDVLTDVEEYSVNQKIQYLSAGMEARYRYKNFFVSGSLMLKDSYLTPLYTPFRFSLWSVNLKTGYFFGR